MIDPSITIHKGTFAHCPKCHCEFSTDPLPDRTEFERLLKDLVEVATQQGNESGMGFRGSDDEDDTEYFKDLIRKLVYGEDH